MAKGSSKNYIRHCERSEAIFCNTHKYTDCFGSVFLAKTSFGIFRTTFKKILILLLFAMLPFSGEASITMSVSSGSIKNTSQVDKISVNTRHNLIHVVFEFPRSLQLWVRIKGQTGIVLAEYNLAEGNLVTLNGGGQFTLEVFSKGGSGNWQCFAYQNDEGSITSRGQIDRMDMFAYASPIYLIFEYEEGLELWARVMGNDGKPMGEYNMTEGNVLTFEGGGEYRIELFAKKGIGGWKIYFYNKNEYDKLKK